MNGKSEEKDWSATRATKNKDTKQGIENPTNADIRCYSSGNAASVMTVPAGATIHYISTQQVNHPGPTQYYIAKVPSGASVTSWDGSGAVWAKISTTMPKVDANKQLTWPAQSKYTSEQVCMRLHILMSSRRIQDCQRNDAKGYTEWRLLAARRAYCAAHGFAGQQSSILLGLLSDYGHWRWKWNSRPLGTKAQVQAAFETFTNCLAHHRHLSPEHTRVLIPEFL